MVKDKDQDTIFLRGQFIMCPNQENALYIMSLICLKGAVEVLVPASTTASVVVAAKMAILAIAMRGNAEIMEDATVLNVPILQHVTADAAVSRATVLDEDSSFNAMFNFGVSEGCSCCMSLYV